MKHFKKVFSKSVEICNTTGHRKKTNKKESELTHQDV